MIAIIGAGPAGLAAAVTAAKKGEKVILIDSSTRLGGQYWRHLPSNWKQKRLPYFAEAQELFDQVLSSPLITWYSNAHVWQAEKKNEIFYLYVVKNGVEEVITAQKVILATGAYDRSLPFPGWTGPGVMTPGAAQAIAWHRKSWSPRGLLPVWRCVLWKMPASFPSGPARAS